MMLKGIDNSAVTTEENDDKKIADSVSLFKINVVGITSKLSDKGDSEVIVDLLMAFQNLANQNVTLRRRNRDLLNQLTVSGPSYSKIEEELGKKFEKYKLQIERENLLIDVENQKIIHVQRKQNAELLKENSTLKAANEEMISKIETLKAANEEMISKIETLKAANEEMIPRIQALETTSSESAIAVRELKNEVLKLNKKVEDIEFQNYITDIFRYIRDGIISKGSSTKFPKESDCMSMLYHPKDLEYPEEDDYEESYLDEMNAEIALVDERRVAYEEASKFLNSLGLDASLVRDLRVFSQARNGNTLDEDCKLKTKLKVTHKKNQATLKELRVIIERIDEGHTAFPLKARLVSWFDSVICS